MKKKRNKLIDSIVEIWQGNRFLVRPFLVMCTIYLLGISAIILAGVHYADDVARTNYGYAGWSGFSRYLSTILAHGLHADNYLTNIAPLPQILAVAVLAAASIMMICIVSGKEIFKEYWTKWIWRVVAVVPLGLCPYMLECLSYQYDAIYMAMSVFFATWPLIFRRQSKVLYAMMVVMGILIVCTTYQVSIGIYPMLVIFITMKEWSEKKKINNKENWAFLLLSAVVFSLTVVVFQKFLMIPRDVYASNVVPGIGEFLPEFFAHLGQYFSLLVSDFKILWLVLIGIIGISFVVLFVIKSRRNKFMATVVALVGVVLMAVMAYALYAALDKPLYTTRAMYAIGAFVAIMGIYI
ncbi:MAG: glucosyltransferase domain-containing protein, partial [Alphaproteobacteria bacterium]|nr:glucosyltransferase domain-containing protein [Alphaproteobacteria bacterium]